MHTICQRTPISVHYVQSLNICFSNPPIYADFAVIDDTELMIQLGCYACIGARKAQIHSIRPGIVPVFWVDECKQGNALHNITELATPPLGRHQATDPLDCLHNIKNEQSAILCLCNFNTYEHIITLGIFATWLTSSEPHLRPCTASLQVVFLSVVSYIELQFTCLMHWWRLHQKPHRLHGGVPHEVDIVSARLYLELCFPCNTQ